MKMISKRQVLLLHRELIAEFGGIDGIRDEGLLDSALYAPFHSFGGAEVYPSLLEKAARLGFGLIKNHPFLDGNKRIGTHVMLLFLAVNHVQLDYDDDDLIQIILHIAAGQLDDKALLQWLQMHFI